MDDGKHAQGVAQALADLLNASARARDEMEREFWRGTPPVDIEAETAAGKVILRPSPYTDVAREFSTYVIDDSEDRPADPEAVARWWRANIAKDVPGGKE